MPFKPKVYDCTMFTYEPSAYRVRVTQLINVVDLHVVTVADLSFSGKKVEFPKPPPVRSTKRVTVEKLHVDPQTPIDMLGPGQTSIERLVRNQSLEAAWEASGHDETAFFLVADCDEIPHPDAVRQAISEYKLRGPRVLYLDARCWYADMTPYPNGYPPAHHANQPIIGRYQDFHDLGGAMEAYIERSTPGRAGGTWKVAQSVGWHLSDLDGPKMVSDKFGLFSHVEDDNEHDRDEEFLRDCRNRRVWPKHEWPLHSTDFVPPSVPNVFPKLLSPEWHARHPGYSTVAR